MLPVSAVTSSAATRSIVGFDGNASEQVTTRCRRLVAQPFQVGLDRERLAGARRARG